MHGSVRRAGDQIDAAGLGRGGQDGALVKAGGRALFQPVAVFREQMLRQAVVAREQAEQLSGGTALDRRQGNGRIPAGGGQRKPCLLYTSCQASWNSPLFSVHPNYMLDFPVKSAIMEKQLKNRQFGTILSINKTTGKASIETEFRSGRAAPHSAVRGKSPSAILHAAKTACRTVALYQKSGARPGF